ncbi:NCS2 family permease [Enterococcus sp. LJL120]
MTFIEDLIAAIGVVLNGIPQGILAMTLGFAVFPTTFSFIFASAVNGIFHSVAPLSFQAESLAITGDIGKTHKERISIIFFGSLIMFFIGISGLLTQIVDFLGENIISGMMAGVGIMLAKISLNMVKSDREIGLVSLITAVFIYLLTKDLVWTITLSVILATFYARIKTKYSVDLPEHVTQRKFVFTKPIMNTAVARGALSLACLNISANISYGLLTGQMTGIEPNPVNLNLLTITQSIADLGTSLLGGAPVEAVISATGSAPNPVLSGIMMMLIMAVILFSGLLPKIGKFVPSSSISGFLFVLGTFIVFPDNASLAVAGTDSTIGAITLLITAVVDPFFGLVAGAFFKIILPILGLGV